MSMLIWILTQRNLVPRLILKSTLTLRRLFIELSSFTSHNCKTKYKIYTQAVSNKLCGRSPQYTPPPASVPLTFVLESRVRVTWATSVPILDFLGLSVLDLGPRYATDRQTSDAHHRFMPPPYGAWA